MSLWPDVFYLSPTLSLTEFSAIPTISQPEQENQGNGAIPRPTPDQRSQFPILHPRPDLINWPPTPDPAVVVRAPLPPQVPDSDPSASGNSSLTTPMAAPELWNGSVQMNALIPKEMPYQRPLHPKLFCPSCNDHPEGFREEHELQRHTDRAHGIRKVWI